MAAGSPGRTRDLTVTTRYIYRLRLRPCPLSWQPAPNAAPSSTPDANAAYCSAACRQRAYRRQRKAGADQRRNVPRPATIGSLISALETITGALEKHTADMNYPGTDEFNIHTFHRHPFDDNAYEVLHDLTQRMEGVSNDLCSAEEERQIYEALTPRQQKSRTVELEEIAHDAQASAGRDAEWERGATARETAWAALPSEVTAPGRYHESVK